VLEKVRGQERREGWGEEERKGVVVRIVLGRSRKSAFKREEGVGGKTEKRTKERERERKIERETEKRTRERERERKIEKETERERERERARGRKRVCERAKDARTYTHVQLGDVTAREERGEGMEMRRDESGMRSRMRSLMCLIHMCHEAHMNMRHI